MGVFSRLFKSAPGPAPQARGEITLFGGTETLEVVGEASYQDALWNIVGRRTPHRVRVQVVAVLTREPTNPYDPNAIQVRVNGHCVGYLCRADAVRYGPGLDRLEAGCGEGRVALSGVVVGGGPREDRMGLLGVFLDHSPSDFGLTPARASEIDGFRTGFSEAWASDMEDDSYDLSWFASLSENDAKAIAQLRRHLTNDPDPIDRHYLMCELEKRLYRCRDVFGSALAEYDDVCRQHDSEMAVIAAALMAKFQRLPLLDTYRQAAIRHQKAKDWSQSLWWAERGLAVYGPNAGVPGVVDDLVKRRELARTKLEPPARAARVPAQRPAPSRTGAGELERLVCAVCGRAFERVRVRGRKPESCPDCRAA